MLRVYVLYTRMKVNTTLVTVDLSYNGLSDDGSVALGRYVRINTKIRHLDVTNNRISATGAKVFSTGLKKNETLDILRVRLHIILDRLLTHYSLI